MKIDSWRTCEKLNFAPFERCEKSKFESLESSKKTVISTKLKIWPTKCEKIDFCSVKNYWKLKLAQICNTEILQNCKV